jgi:N-acetylneuraminate synthase
MNKNDIFKDLFVLEMTNNHLGDIKRGLKIISEYSKVVRFNNVKAAIKLQFRDIDNFVHKNYKTRLDIRYIKRITETNLSDKGYETLVKAIRKSSMIPMSTPFDEKSVEFCERLDLPIIKIASADNNDWTLLNRIAETKKPVIVSLGGLSIKDTDDLVSFFEKRNIPLALNHCIACYPTKEHNLQLNQIDFLKNRYPDHVIGLSTHEEGDSALSIMVAYAKGARTFEKHIDINYQEVQISKYSSLPNQIDSWFKAWHKAKIICGASSEERVLPLDEEITFLDNYIRGVYLKKDLKSRSIINKEDIYLAIPLHKGQISCRELMLGDYGLVLKKDCSVDSPLMIDDIESIYSEDNNLKTTIYNRGLTMTT